MGLARETGSSVTSMKDALRSHQVSFTDILSHQWLKKHGSLVLLYEYGSPSDLKRL